MQRLCVPLTNCLMVEASISSVSSLGSRKSPQATCSFPVHPLLDKLMYDDWVHPDKLFLLQKKIPSFILWREVSLRNGDYLLLMELFLVQTKA